MGVPVNPHPSDEDLEWLYPSCLLYGKECFRAFRSIPNYRYIWYVAKSNYVAMKIFLTGRKKFQFSNSNFEVMDNVLKFQIREG